MNLGKTIKDLRLKAGLSQGKLAEMSGVTSSAISQIELGKIEPKKSVLDSIADALLPGANSTVLMVMSINEDDVPEDKKDFFIDIFPSMKKVMNSIWGLEYQDENSQDNLPKHR